MRYYIASANTGEVAQGWYSTKVKANTQRDNWNDVGNLTFLVKAQNRSEAVAKAVKAHQTGDYKAARS